PPSTTLFDTLSLHDALPILKAHLRIYNKLVALHLPFEPQNNPFSALIASNDPHAFASSYAYNVAPVTDNAPFFFFTLKLDQLLQDRKSTRLNSSHEWISYAV